MMSFSKMTFADVMKRQYVFKWKAYFGVFGSLAVIQLLGLLFSFTGVSSYGSGGENHSVNVTYYSADMVIVFTMLWAFSTAILITTRAYRDDDFAFVTNRLSSSLSNILFLLTASVIGGLTAWLSRFLLALILYYGFDYSFADGGYSFPAAGEMVMGIIAVFLYIVLFSALGYLTGMFVQVSKIFVVLLPAVLIGSLILGARMTNYEGNPVFEFFFFESSYSLFLVKVIVTIILSFLLATVGFNRLEVRK